MNLFHHFHRVLYCLLIYISGFSVAYANDDWQNIEALLENDQHLVAIEQLDENLKNASSMLDNKEWTLILLRGARLRAIGVSQGAAINYLHYSQWPSDKLSQSILNLALAKEYEQYLIGADGPFSNHTASKKEKKANAFTLTQLFDDINLRYQLAFDIANENNLTIKQAESYLTRGDYPDAVRGKLADVIVAYWQQFLADDTYWTDQQKNDLNILDLSHLLDFQNHESLKHPLLKAKQLSKQSIKRHQSNGRAEAVFEAKRYYIQLLTRHFSDDRHINQLSDFLSIQLTQLGSQHPWWTMGQFQLLSLKKKLVQQLSLIEIHDLAVQASIIHPTSLGTKKSQELINELEFSEYMITGLQSSELNKPSIEIEFRNLQKLYFRAWRLIEPLPIQIDGELKTKIISTLLTKDSESEWVVNLPDQFDLSKRNIQHSPQINRYGNWLILASPKKNFKDTKSGLQLISMQFSRYVASAEYVDEVFNVAVYQNENGLPESNVSVDLLAVENGIETVLSTNKTDQKGIAKFRRETDADHFQISVRSGDDRLLIDIPSLLPLKDEKAWSQHQAKSLLMTDKDLYIEGEAIHWSILSRATADKSSIAIMANANQKAWIRFFDENNRLVFKKSFITDDVGTATGKVMLSCDCLPKLFVKSEATGAAEDIGREQLRITQSYRIETSWGGNKTIVVKQSKANTEKMAPDVRNPLEAKEKLSQDDHRRHKLKHSFTLFNEPSEQNTLEVAIEDGSSLNDKRPHYSLLSAQNYFTEGELKAFNLLKNNSHSLLSQEDSRWYIYELLPSPNKATIDGQSAYSSPSWVTGGVKQSGAVVHDSNGKAKLPIKQLESGMYRLRVVSESGLKQSIFEHDFLVVKNGVSKNIKLSGVLLTEKRQLTPNSNTLRLLAGSGGYKQWSRLTISKDDKQLASQMLSPGIHLLNFPINESHEGGLNFSLEWVENNQIAYRDIHVEIPWISKRLALSITEAKDIEAPSWRLKVLDKQRQALVGSTKSKVLLYFTETVKGDVQPEPLNLDSLYWQSRSSAMRLNSNGKSYPHYFSSQSKHFPSHISDIVELPQIRYSLNNKLIDDSSDFFISPLEAQSSLVADIAGMKQSLSLGQLVEQNKDSPPTLVKDQQHRLTHFLEASLDTTGSLTIEMPEKFKDKQVNLRAVVVTSDMKTGQLSVTLR